MKATVAFALLAGAACSTAERPLTAHELETYPAASRAPADVQRFIARWSDCARWLARDPWTRAEVSEIGEAQHRFCPGIDMRARRLRSRYADDPEILALLEEFDRLGE